MSHHTPKAVPAANLRKRAHALLREDNIALDPPGEQASKALRVLYQLAASPETAPSALAMLHELQVHQVELELQADTLQSAHDELASALARQMQLYDCAPNPYFTVGYDTRVWDANLSAADTLGVERQALVGLRLDGFVEPSQSLASLMAQVRRTEQVVSGMLQLKPRRGQAHAVCASLRADPAGDRVLVNLSGWPTVAN